MKADISAQWGRYTQLCVCVCVLRFSAFPFPSSSSVSSLRLFSFSFPFSPLFSPFLPFSCPLFLSRLRRHRYILVLFLWPCRIKPRSPAIFARISLPVSELLAIPYLLVWRPRCVHSLFSTHFFTFSSLLSCLTPADRGYCRDGRPHMCGSHRAHQDHISGFLPISHNFILLSKALGIGDTWLDGHELPRHRPTHHSHTGLSLPPSPIFLFLPQFASRRAFLLFGKEMSLQSFGTAFKQRVSTSANPLLFQSGPLHVYLVLGVRRKQEGIVVESFSGTECCECGRRWSEASLSSLSLSDTDSLIQ